MVGTGFVEGTVGGEREHVTTQTTMKMPAIIPIIFPAFLILSYQYSLLYKDEHSQAYACLNYTPNRPQIEDLYEANICLIQRSCQTAALPLSYADIGLVWKLAEFLPSNATFAAVAEPRRKLNDFCSLL